MHPQHYYVFHVDSRKEFERQALQRMIEERFTRHQIDTQVFGFFNPENIWSRKVQAQKIWIAIAAHTKGQLISKADWRAIDSPKKRKEEFVSFAFFQIRPLVFWENLRRANLLFSFIWPLAKPNVWLIGAEFSR